MTFDSVLPRNNESRAISMSIKLLRKYAPQIKWIISFADACSCGDGMIYRASNPTTPRKELGGKCYFDITGGRFAWKEFLQKTGAKLLDGWQLRYIYFIDPSYRQRLTVPEIPFSRIDEMGAGMYKGEKVTLAERHSGKHARG